MYIKITPNTSVEIKEIPAGADMLSLMQSEVDGFIETLGTGYLERTLSVIVPGIMMIVNEEGKINVTSTTTSRRQSVLLVDWMISQVMRCSSSVA